MNLNKPSGNMYPWAWTTNPIAGRCRYHCGYCYVWNKIAPWLNRMGNPKYVGKPRLIQEELETPISKPDDGKVIFVQSNGDLFGYWIPRKWIIAILRHCNDYPYWIFLFQSKNPCRFLEFIEEFPQHTVLGTTIETNRGHYIKSKAPTTSTRLLCMTDKKLQKFRKMVSIEPIVDFDMVAMVKWIYEIEPDFVSIGADSGRNNLREPEPKKIEGLIKNLEGFTEVRVKKNLKRLVSGVDATTHRK